MFSLEKIKTGALQTYLLNIDSAESVSAAVLVNVGSRDEVKPREAGMAHMLEHMSLRGTRGFPTSELLSGRVEEVGGYKSAWTNKEGTCYLGRVPHEYRERIFEIVSDIIQIPLMEEKRIVSEKENILKEIKKQKDDPIRTLHELTMSSLLPYHPLSGNVLGERESVSNFTREEVVRFWEKFYIPSNYTLVVAGKIREGEVEKFIERYFRTESRGVPTTRKMVGVKKEENIRTSLHIQNLNQQYFSFAVPFERESGDRPSLIVDLFSRMVGGGVFSPLFQEIREKRGLCYVIQSGVQKFSDLGLFYIYGATDPLKYEEVRQLVFKVMEESCKNERLLQIAKRQKLGQVGLSCESTGTILDFATGQLLSEGKLQDYLEMKSDIESVSISEITQTISKYLLSNPMREIILAP